jgi:hypothetical protein
VRLFGEAKVVVYRGFIGCGNRKTIVSLFSLCFFRMKFSFVQRGGIGVIVSALLKYSVGATESRAAPPFV